MGIKDDLLGRLPQLALMAIAAKQGGPEGQAAFMRGIQDAQARQAQGQRQSMLDMQNSELHAAQMGNLRDDNARADDQLQRQKVQDALALIDKTTQRETDTATDPVQAENNVMRSATTAAGLYGLAPDKLTGMVPNMAAPIAGRDKKHASELYASMEKVYGAEAMANDAITIQSERFGPIKPSALRAKFAAAQDATGAPAVPLLKDPEATTQGSFDAQFGDVLKGEETKLGRKLTATERAALRLRAKTDYDAANDPLHAAPRQRFSVQTYTPPDGKTGFVRVNLETGEAMPVELPEGGGAGRPTDTQALSAGYYQRSVKANTTAASFEAKLATLGSQLDVQLPNLIKSEQGQLYRQSKDEFINAALRRESGAAIQPSEYTRFDKIYFVQPGDTAATIKQKQEARQRVVDGFKVAAGNLGGDTPTGPQIGEKRMINGQLGEWDGKGWKAAP